MIGIRFYFAREASCVLTLMVAVGVRHSMAQSQPAMIPTVVAQAAAFAPDLFGRPQFFNGRAPTDWPTALIPTGAKVLGGVIVGDSSLYRMRVAVFEFPAQGNPRAVIRDMIVRAGYAPRESPRLHSRTGGFLATAPAAPTETYCNGSTLASFGAVDSAHAPRIMSVLLLDGEAGRQNCSQSADEPNPRDFPVTLPTLSPPRGSMQLVSHSNSSSSDGMVSATLRTTMPADSLLAHYSAQLVAGGWKAEGRAANADGIGAERFTFRDGADSWMAYLIVLAFGERRELQLHVTKNE